MLAGFRIFIPGSYSVFNVLAKPEGVVREKRFVGAEKYEG